MVVFRIGHMNYATTLEASGMNSRWVSAGKRVIYAAESIALAFLESMIRRQGVGFNDDYRIVAIDIPDDLLITVIKSEDLQDGWREFRDYSICQRIGDKWYGELKTPVMKVPSAVLNSSFNYVINTKHKSFKKIAIVEVSHLVPDERIEEILKKYPLK